MSDIYEALRSDHDTQRRLSGLVIETHGDSDGREELFARLRRELEAHAAAEERYFYVPLMEHDATQEKARHSVAEHKELDDYVEELSATDMSSPAWLPLAKKLDDRLRHHLAEEEDEVFPAARHVLADAQATELAESYRGDMDRHHDQLA